PTTRGTARLPKTNRWSPSVATLSAKSWRLANRSSRSSVVAPNAADALAFARAISGVTQSAPSIRSQATRWPASSTTAIATLKPSVCARVKPRSMHSRAWRRLSATSRYLDPDLAVLDGHGVRRHRAAARGHEARARPHVVHPAVPGAREPAARQLAFAERAALMDALVVARVDLVVDARQHDARSARVDELDLARRELVQPGDAAATHSSSFAT